MRGDGPLVAQRKRRWQLTQRHSYVDQRSGVPVLTQRSMRHTAQATGSKMAKLSFCLMARATPARGPPAITITSALSTAIATRETSVAAAVSQARSDTAANTVRFPFGRYRIAMIFSATPDLAARSR